MTQTIGQKLKQAREAKHLTLEKIFEATRIRVPYLHALEMDDLSVMPSPVQARGYLRNYAEYLGLNFDQLLDEMRAEKKPSDEIIGPADDASTALSTQTATQTPEPSPPQESTPRFDEAQRGLSQPKPVPAAQTESQPEPNSVEAETPLPKPKPARRKKGDSQAQPESATTPKRRGRKKVEPEPESIPVVESQPEVIEEIILHTEPEPVIGEIVEPQQEPIHQPDVSDNIWQTWLNRLNPKPKQSESLESDGAAALLSGMQEQAPALQSLESTEIFKEIGVELRKRRELLSLHLEEVERNTHVKAHYLEALEKGAMDDLPSTVQTRGMLSNYATFLDLDVDALLLRFADALQARHRERNPQKPARKPGTPIISNIPSIRSFIAGDMVFGIGMAVLLVAFSIWGVSRVMTLQS